MKGWTRVFTKYMTKTGALHESYIPQTWEYDVIGTLIFLQ